MPSAGAFVTFAALSFALVVVPGPSVMFVVSRGVALGRRAALLTVVGNTTGGYVQVLLVAVGLGAVVERSVLAFTAIKLLGAGYLAWLGVEAIRHRRALATVLDTTTTLRPRRSVVLDGFIVGVANPKAIVFFAAILPQYVATGGHRPACRWPCWASCRWPSRSCPTASGASPRVPRGRGSRAHHDDWPGWAAPAGSP